MSSPTSAIALLDDAIALNERAQMDEETALGRSINLKVVSHGKAVFYKIKPNAHLNLLMKAHAHAQRQGINSLRFFFEGNRINKGQTPIDLGMKDGDVVDVLMELQGGGADLNAFSPPPLRAVRRLTPMTKRLKTYKASLPGEPVTFKYVSRNAVTKPWPAKFVAEQECKEGFNKKCVCRNRK